MTDNFDASQPAQPVAHVDGRSYRKKPVVVKAVQWTGENLREVIAFMDGPPETKSHHAFTMWEQFEDLVRKDGLKIYTLEGKMDASPGDWIIKGVKDEFYPCKPDIFAATYEPASQPAQPVAWMAEVHNKYQTRGGYDERIDINEWRQAVTLNEPNGQRYRNIRPLYPAPHPLTVQDAARVVADGLNDGEVWRVAVNGAAAILNSGMPGSYWPTVKQIREALDAALRAISEGQA